MKIFVLIIFLVVLIGVLFSGWTVFYFKSRKAKRCAEELLKIAYIDSLTNLKNRAGCEKLIEQIKTSPPSGDVVAVMFDMNELKQTNDSLGHKAGDKIINAFGTVLKKAANDYGLMCRYGGDEFLALFQNSDENTAQEFIRKVRSGVDKYNENYDLPAEKIKYAVGYCVADSQVMSITDIIDRADSLMYEDKRRSKEMA